MQEEWETYFKKHRLKYLCYVPSEKLTFVANCHIDYKHLDDITLRNGHQEIRIKDYEFVHNFDCDPIEIITICDEFFMKMMKENRIVLGNDEEKIMWEEVSKFFSRGFQFHNVCVPFFYALRIANKGIQRAKQDFEPERIDLPYHKFISFVIYKTLHSEVIRRNHQKNFRKFNPTVI